MEKRKKAAEKKQLLEVETSHDFLMPSQRVESDFQVKKSDLLPSHFLSLMDS